MEGILHAVAAFLKVDQRTAFALFAAGAAPWILVHEGVVTHDAVELSVAYLTAFGFFVWIQFMLAGAARRLRARRRRRRASDRAKTRAAAVQAREAAYRLQAEKEVQRKRDRTIANLGHLAQPESETVWWMHHRQQFRIRANQRWREID